MDATYMLVLVIGILVILFEALAGITSNVLANYLQEWLESHRKFKQVSQTHRLTIATTIFVFSQLALVFFLVLISNFSAQEIVQTDSVPTTLPTYTVGPTQTPNAYEVQVENLMDPSLKVLEKSIVDLDGVGPDEIVIRYEDANFENNAANSRVEELEELAGMVVFSYFNNGWRSVLKLPKLEESCGLYFGDYGIVDLFHDTSRQVVVWLNCGTGAFLGFEIYQYRGLGFLERIYRNETRNHVTGEYDYKWLESGIYIANEQLFVSHPHGLYQYVWDGEAIVATANPIDPGPNGVIVEYWVNPDGTLHASQENVILKVGQFIYLKQIEGSNYPEDPRIQFSNSDVLSFETPTIYFAESEGTTGIYLRPWHDKPMITLTVVAP